MRSLALLWLCLMTPLARAQAVDATHWDSGTLDLDSGWRAHQGDNLVWAQPGFDDSSWNAVDLENLGPAQPGWSWYRIHVKLEHGHRHEHILIVGGEGVYAAYLNGQLIEDADLKPWYALKRPVEEVVPLDNDRDEFTLALRTHAIPTYTLWHLPLFLTISLGTADAIDTEQRAWESQRLYQAFPSIAINLVLILAGLGAFALYRSQRQHAEYLWLGWYLFLVGSSNGLLYSSSAGILTLPFNNLLGDPLIFIVTVLQIEFTFSFAGRRVGRIWRAYQAVLCTLPIVTVMVTIGLLSITPYIAVEGLAILPAALLLPALLLRWYRRGNREAGWLILPSLLPAASAALYDLGSVSIFMGWGRLDFLANPIPLGPLPLQISDLADFLFLMAIAVVMFFRFTRVSREQARVAAELEAARGIQQRLVPAQLPEVRGYAIEAAYFPALEVGGDFYQVLEHAQGTQVVVVGDVSGKGLKAAMTGTLAMGALRALTTEGLGPAAMLMRLNRQLVETAEGGFVTCICVRLGKSGEIIVSNAGHLSPYRNGEELRLGSDLPLGIAPEVMYVEHVFQMEPGDQLTLLSDGVLEARDTTGALFGFERMRAISAQSAESIAAAACRFGQEDDITVVTLTRMRRSAVPDVVPVATG
jgi:sigma-B regulation protein RsbU (phosphoserine phosphatase)